MDKLITLLDEYEALHPKAENPLNFFNVLGLEGLIEMLEKANGRQIKWIPDFAGDTEDGGEIQYI